MNPPLSLRLNMDLFFYISAEMSWSSFCYNMDNLDNKAFFSGRSEILLQRETAWLPGDKVCMTPTSQGRFH